MNNPARTEVAMVLVFALIAGFGVAFLAISSRPPAVLAQTSQRVITATPISVKGAAAVQATATFSTTDFDNQIFILSPAVRPERFVDCVDNQFYPMIPGTVYHYEAEVEDGMETTTVTMTDQIEEVMGISTTVVYDVVRLNGELLEETYDWYAQDKAGNIWYFGEDVTNYNLEDGTIDHDGAWKAGVDGAVPGIIMLANPVVGDIYREEYWEGEAMDMAAVASVHKFASTQLGTFENTLETANYNTLDEELEQKVYAVGIGFVVEEHVENGERTELVSISHDASMMSTNQSCGQNGGVTFVGTLPVTDSVNSLRGMAEISVAEAEDAALVANPDTTVVNTQLAVEHGFLVYEIELDNGAEVVVDAGDGVLLFTEMDEGESGDVEDMSEEDDSKSEDGDDLDGEVNEAADTEK